FTPTILTGRFNSATRPHACASLQTCLFWHAVTRLFAGWCHSSPLQAQQGLGVGLQDHRFYSRTNFKLNRAAALAE
ncbi:hypothetical protein OAO82_01230, partial [bacterium]|nr:hypothetical protein [bacterium]